VDSGGAGEPHVHFFFSHPFSSVPFPFYYLPIVGRRYLARCSSRPAYLCVKISTSSFPCDPLFPLLRQPSLLGSSRLVVSTFLDDARDTQSRKPLLDHLVCPTLCVSFSSPRFCMGYDAQILGLHLFLNRHLRPLRLFSVRMHGGLETVARTA